VYGKWIVNDEIEAKNIVSTIPLKELVHIINIPDISHELTRYSKFLDFNSLIVIGIALRKKSLDMHWVYVPDKNIIFLDMHGFRITVHIILQIRTNFHRL
jgi:protoporphyrinogen oxidase